MNLKETIQKNLLPLAAFAIALAVAVAALFFPLPQKETKPTFSVENFTIKTETVDYEYMDDTVNYTGTGTITCSDAKNTYLVVLAYTDATREETAGTRLVLVENGTGSFTTYDYGTVGTMEEPQYTFTVTNFTRMESTQ